MNITKKKIFTLLFYRFRGRIVRQGEEFMPNSNEHLTNHHHTVKTFVLDTNVLIHKPDAFLSFKENNVVIPLFVLEELDKLKSSSHEKGFSAREAIRQLESRVPISGIKTGIKIENGITLSFEASIAQLPPGLLPDQMDNKILGVALHLQQEGKDVFFVSKDINARVKAATLGLRIVDYEKQKVNAKHLYEGWKALNLSSEKKDYLIEKSSLSTEETFLPNQYALFNLKEEKETLICRYEEDLNTLVLMEEITKPICGIKPLNPLQAMAMDLLLNPAIQLVSLIGQAGTGKTLLAIACGLKQVLDDKLYTKVLVARPIIPMGNDIGYLPGTKKEKLFSWMQPIFDNLAVIFTNYKHSEYKTVDTLTNKDKIEVEALTYIRGRSLPQQFIIIDEAQNLTPHEIKTIVSRAGKGSKIVLTGDPHQIDNTYLDANSNGLCYLIDAFKGQSVFGHITLAKSERSPLAELATQLL